eukprot:Colp12_sorted_trinity150504_noHs@30975
MAGREGRGTANMVEKLKDRVARGEHYEAHQIYRTLYARYLATNKGQDALELVTSGATELFKAKEFTSGGDLALLVLDYYNKIQVPVTTESLDRLVGVFELFSEDIAIRKKFMKEALRWSSKYGPNTRGAPELHQAFARKLWKEGSYSLSQGHFLHAGEAAVSDFTAMLIEWSTKGYSSEVDLFLARAILQYLCLEDLKNANALFSLFVTSHPKIADSHAHSPLVNFLRFLLLTVQRDAAPLFRMLRAKYRDALARDPTFEQYVTKIGELFFNERPPQQGGLGNMMSLFQNMFGGGFADDDDDGQDLD